MNVETTLLPDLNIDVEDNIKIHGTIIIGNKDLFNI